MTTYSEYGNAPT